MKDRSLLFLFLFLVGSVVHGQSIIGEWKTYDDKTGKAEAIVEIYEEDDKYYGRIKEVLREVPGDRKICTQCKGELKNEPLRGLRILRGFTEKDDKYVGGRITDPKTGKTYRARLWLDEDDPNKLKVRGYVLFFYRTQTWERVN